MADEKRRVTIGEWHAEGLARYGPEVKQWKFRCPSCGFVQTAMDYRAYNAPVRDIDRRLAFNCIGRTILNACPTADVVDFAEPHRGFGCNYTGSGLFRINPVEVVIDSTEAGIRETFEWADPAPGSQT